MLVQDAKRGIFYNIYDNKTESTTRPIAFFSHSFYQSRLWSAYLFTYLSIISYNRIDLSQYIDTVNPISTTDDLSKMIYLSTDV